MQVVIELKLSCEFRTENYRNSDLLGIFNTEVISVKNGYS